MSCWGTLVRAISTLCPEFSRQNVVASTLLAEGNTELMDS